MLLSGYASDSDSGSDAEIAPAAPAMPKPKARPTVSSAAAKASPAPSAAGSGGATGTAAGPKGKKRTGPIKITLDLPKASKGKGNGSDGEDDGAGSDGEGKGEGNEENADEDRAAKRVKLGGKGLKGGAGASSLLGMLPAPKRKLPASSAKSTLGGGGGDKGSSLSINAASIKLPSAGSRANGISGSGTPGEGQDEADEEGARAGPSSLLPASMARKAAKAGAAKRQEEEELDLFGLGSSSTPAPPKPSSTSLLAPTSSISSAPAISEFVPPEPTPNDPYPGYYQLPSGQWAAYEPDYYHSFFPDTEADSRAGKADDGRVGHGWSDLRDRELDMVDVHASEGLAEARVEEERRQMRTKPKLAGDDFVYQAVGATKGVAADRHQLSSLLNSAYTQREALEERIALNKKNSRTGRAKYGF